MKKGVSVARGEGSLDEPLLRPLLDDLVECEELLQRADTQFARRTFIRSLFAFNEGFLYWLKENVRQWLLDKGWRTNTIQVSKLELLADSSYRVNRVGKMESEPTRIPYLNYCAFVLRSAAECRGLDANQLFSDNGWKGMQVSLEVRHRITHPKKPEDLEISNEELDSTREGHRWLIASLVKILRSSPDSSHSLGERSSTTPGDCS
jgi:hypothetical protein